MQSAEKLRDNEEREAEAFNQIAGKMDPLSMVTSDWTFDRYRAATNQVPLFDSYPDLTFSIIGERIGVNQGSENAKPLSGLKVLDLGAGDGIWSVILAEQGADVSSVEISPVQVSLAELRMKNHDLKWDATIGSAFELDEIYESETFDLVFGPAILHHLTYDLPSVYSGAAAVLKPGGFAIFTEPYMGMKWLRRLRLKMVSFIPVVAESPDERPISDADIAPMFDYFSSIDFDYADIFAKFPRRFSKSQKLFQSVSNFDRSLLKIGPMHRLSSSVVITATK